MSLRYASVCSGIEAPSVAWKPLGWQPVFYSEIEPFPCEVLRLRHGETPNIGDMTQFREWPDYAIDVLIGGTPCQSLECERLQGFPDDYTLIPWRGKPADECPDGPRYKAIGNSMAVTVIELIGERIEQVEAIPA